MVIMQDADPEPEYELHSLWQKTCDASTHWPNVFEVTFSAVKLRFGVAAEVHDWSVLAVVFRMLNLMQKDRMPEVAAACLADLTHSFLSCQDLISLASLSVVEGLVIKEEQHLEKRARSSHPMAIAGR